MESTKAKRIYGFDFARALAVLGMVIVNFKIVMNASDNGPGWLVGLVGLLEGRAAALFVVLAGVGLSLMSSKARESGDRSELASVRYTLFKRAIFLFVVGLAYTPLWPADILHFYGIYIAIAAVLINISNVKLWWSAAIFILGFVVLNLFLNYEIGWDWSTLEYANFWTVKGMLRHLFFNGFHPVIPWAAFVFMGMWLGRQDMTSKSFRRKLIIWSLIILVVVEGFSRLSIGMLKGLVSKVEMVDIIALIGTSPMPPFPQYFLSAGATAFIVITLCVKLTESSYDNLFVKSLIRTGQLALTLYVAHVILGMGTLEILGLLEGQSLSIVILAAFVFFITGVLFSSLWRMKFRRGPLEIIMRKLTG